MTHESSLTSLINYIVEDHFNIKKWIKQISDQFTTDNDKFNNSQMIINYMRGLNIYNNKEQPNNIKKNIVLKRLKEY